MKISIVRKLETLVVEFYLYDRGDSFIETYSIKDGVVVGERKEYKFGDNPDIKPTFVLQEPHARELIKAFADLADAEGVERTTESFAKGKLESQSEHLRDLRKLLKL